MLIINFTVLILTLLIGITAYKYLNPSARLFFYQLVAWILLLALSYYITHYQKQHVMKQNNQWLFNCSLLIEFTSLFMAAHAYFQNIITKRLILLLLVFCLSSYAIEFIYKGFMQYFSITDTIESIFMVIVFGYLLYDAIHQLKDKVSMIWITTGLFIYFGCSVPYISVFSYLQKNDSLLFRIITDVLANIRYVFLAVGFGIVVYQNRMKPSTING